ncbi:MAG: glycoside hydrolase family 25 protein [Oscillospiraceae bacterium]|nr:glycoside hydrolase family 25 protein [Oscillospiraceae bacterium]
MKRVLVMFLACVMVSAFSSSVSVSVAPVSNLTVTFTELIEWDGIVPLDSGRTYVVSQQLKITGAHTVPATTSLEILQGGELLLARSARLNVQGGLHIMNGGRIINSGVVTLEHKSVHERLVPVANAFVNTRNGELNDNSKTHDLFLFTAEAISNQPLVYTRGIDASFHQGDIDWSSVAATGIDFAMLRIGAGAVTQDNGNFLPDRMDERFREYIFGAQNYGIDVGVYWFSYARTVEEIEREARFMVRMLGEFDIPYPVVLDMEMNIMKYPDWYIDDASDMAEAFLQIVADAGYYPMLYSFRSWLTELIETRILDKYAVWVAHWNPNGTDYPRNHYMWQYSSTGRVSGITGNNGEVDLNIGYRDFGAYIRTNGLNGF